ncbi:hypothetical protein Egran_03149 [Elaphomyces granulatus]|uniref:Mid2 domain-containing protein n=1 Tax=Elaphomyces granulatus TaxID=519963 RepID=A0A232LYH7_9EURO|nr:hypothetical protein Egran_03149 [Elaphomyces granulatus]
MFSVKQTPLGLLANGQETEVVPTAPPGVQPRWLPQRRATPATCGFIDGSPANIVSCRAGNVCVATGSYIGCCENTSSCSRIYTKCYDSSGSSCNSSCSQDSSNLICTSTGTLPYCVIYDYNSGAATGYGCGSTSGTLNVLYSATSPSATVVTTLEVTPTASTTGTPSTNSSSLSSGSIAGIVVGSIAAIVILLAVAIWLRRRRRSPNQLTTQGPAGTGPGPKELPLSQNIGYRPIPPPSASDTLSEYQAPSELEGGLSLPSSPDPRKGSNSTPMDTIAERNAVHELPGSVAERPELELTVPGNRESQV